MSQERRNVLPFGALACALELAAGCPAYLVGDYLFGWNQPITTLQIAALGVAFAAVAVLAMTAWSQFQIARFHLYVVGGLPWKGMAFLRNAQQRGILRQVGGCYQFRCAELQHRLTPPRSAVPARPAAASQRVAS